MNRFDIIKFLEKYKKVCSILNLHDDVYTFDFVISCFKSKKIIIDSEKPKIDKVKKTYEDIFYTITTEKEIDFSKYKINQKIIENIKDIINFWDKLDVNSKYEFNSLELNLIMYYLTNKNDSFIKKEKKKIIMDIDLTVRSKITKNSYNNIIV